MTDVRFNPDMLSLARDIRGLTQSELAAKAGITQALVSKLEHGLIGQLSDDISAKLGKALNFPKSFFVQSDRKEGYPHFHYRKRVRLGAKPLAHINAVINLRRMHIAKLLRSYEIDVAKPIPQIDLDEAGVVPEKLAGMLREYWMIPRGPVLNLTNLIEEAGGIVVLCRFNTNLLDGISFRSVGLPPIFCMNKDVPGDRYRFSLAHELGHMIMHTVPTDDEKMEKEAHRFAAAFLMPATDIRAHLSAPKLSNLGRVKAHWRVSIKALVKRAHDLKLITDIQFRNLMVGYSKAFKEGEPFALAIEQPARLKQIAMFHIERLGYSLGELADLLCVTADEAQRAYIGQAQGLRLVVSN